MYDTTRHKVAFLVANEGVEQIELVQPWRAVVEMGGEPELLAPADGTVQAFEHLDKRATFTVDRVVADARANDYAALVLPGGVANPDILRTRPEAVAFVRAFFERGKPVAAICHAPWTLIEADVVRGRQLTSWPSLRTDIRKAGGLWLDDAVVVCRAGPNVLVSSRAPADLPAFCRALVDAVRTTVPASVG